MSWPARPDRDGDLLLTQQNSSSSAAHRAPAPNDSQQHHHVAPLDSTQHHQPHANGGDSRRESDSAEVPLVGGRGTAGSSGEKGGAHGEWDSEKGASGGAQQRRGEDHGGGQPASAAEERLHMRRVIISSIVGNALEWYDFLVYVYLGSIISRLFFPEADVFTRLLAYYGIFAAGFVVRPLGALFFGYVGDRWGRKTALVSSIYAMAVPTFLMGCLPTYAQVGVAAPVLLIITRVVQGFAVGGEFTATVVFLVEHAPPQRRGVMGSLAFTSVMVGVLAGSLVATLFINVLSPSALQSWGWRIPFLLSIAGSAVGVYIRRHLKEPDAESVAAPADASHLALSAAPTLARMAAGVGAVVLIDFLLAAGFYLTVIFLPLYFVEFAQLSAGGSLAVNSVNMLLYGVVIPVGGALSDRVGRAPVLLGPCFLTIVLAYPLWMLFRTGTLGAAWLAQAVMVVLMALFTGPLPATLVSLFPPAHRCLGVSLGHNLSMAAFGGTTPIIATALIRSTGDIASPAALLIISAALSACGVVALRYGFGVR